MPQLALFPRISLFLTFVLTIGVAAIAPTSAFTQEVNADSEASRTDSDLVEVWRCSFDESWDVNYDSWPDRWTRVRDSDYPPYVQIGLEERAPESSEHYLVIRPEGASAKASSPPIHVLPKFSYKLRMRLKTEKVDYGKVVIRMTFVTPKGEIRQVEESEVSIVDGKWQDIEIGDYQPRNRSVDRMILHIDFQRGDRSDLNASVSVADLRLYRLPSIRIYTDSHYNVYTDPSDVKVTCSLSGILEQNPEIRFQLLDATNKTIGSGGVLELDGRVISVSSTRASEIVDGFGSDKDSYEGAIDWRPPISDYGFYRVRVGMFSTETGEPVGDSRAITIAVVRENLETTEDGEFGWSLPRADQPLSFDILQELLPLAGVNLVKVPVWFPEDEPERGDQLVRFAEQLAAREIETVGVLDDPTDRIANPLCDAPPSPVEELFSSDPSYWLSLVDHVITKLSMRIHWWQLGYDSDTSFVGYEQLIPKIGSIRDLMFRFGQDIRLGIGWRWDHVVDWDERLTWDFEQLSGSESMNSEQLGHALENAPATTANRWVLVEPPEDDTSSTNIVEKHQNRVRDFVEQIIIAKVHDADGIFIANPFSGSPDTVSGVTGVMNNDGTPGELLLPWRTCARLLGGAQYLGTIQLPHNSRNWLFKRTDGRIVMVLWNLDAEVEGLDAAPIEETLYLGEDVQVIDVWGKSSPPELLDGKQIVKIGRMPRFILGLNEWVSRWRMAAQFQTQEIPSVFGSTYQNAVLVHNVFPQGVGGEMRLFVPSLLKDEMTGSQLASDEWILSPNKVRFSLAANEVLNEPFEILLREADYGPQPIRLDFDVTADRDYEFSVWRKMNVGLGDLTLDVSTRVTKDGRLLVEQHMTNSSGTASDFKCLLYAHNRRRKRKLVFQLGPDIDKKTYTYVDGASLIGTELKLRLEQVDGPRVLIHRFIAEEDSDSQEQDKTELTNEQW